MRYSTRLWVVVVSQAHQRVSSKYSAVHCCPSYGSQHFRCIKHFNSTVFPTYEGLSEHSLKRMHHIITKTTRACSKTANKRAASLRKKIVWRFHRAKWRPEQCLETWITSQKDWRKVILGRETPCRDKSVQQHCISRGSRRALILAFPCEAFLQTPGVNPGARISLGTLTQAAGG